MDSVGILLRCTTRRGGVFRWAERRIYRGDTGTRRGCYRVPLCAPLRVLAIFAVKNHFDAATPSASPRLRGEKSCRRGERP